MNKMRKQKKGKKYLSIYTPTAITASPDKGLMVQLC